MGGNVNRSTGRGVGPTGAGKGADTGTAAADGAAAVDTCDQLFSVCTIGGKSKSVALELDI